MLPKCAAIAAWTGATGTPYHPVTGAVFDHSVALAELAASSAALSPVAMVERPISQGRLAQPFGLTVFAGRYSLARTSDRRVSPGMSVFANWLSLRSAA